MPFKSKELLYYFFQVGHALDALLGISDECVVATTRDPSTLQNTMLISGLHYSWNKGDLSNFETTVLFHKTQSIRRINAWLDRTSRAEEVRLCAQHISALCFIECCLGNFAVAESHLNGLIAYLSVQQSDESDSDDFHNIETELVDRYLILAYTGVHSLKCCLNDFLVSCSGCQDDSPPSDSEESRRLIHEWHVRKSGLDLRLQALRIVPFFFSSVFTDKIPSDIDVCPTIKVLQDITYLHDARHTAESSEVAIASLWRMWNTSGTSRLLFMVFNAHIQSFSDRIQLPIGGRQPITSSWSGFCVAAGMYFCTVLGIWNRGFPFNSGLHRRMIKILQRDLQRSLSCLETVGKEGQALWFWKAFIGGLSLVHAKSDSCNKWLDVELSALIDKLQTWTVVLTVSIQESKETMPDLDTYTVGWICAIHTELVAAMGFLDDRHTEPVGAPANDNNSYTLGRIGQHNVVIATLPHGQYGQTSAASVGRDMVRTFRNVRVGLMVGIGGGVPTKHDIRLGDVVVSSPIRRSGGVIQYDYGTAMQGRGSVIKGTLNQPPLCILTAINTLSAEHEIDGHNLEEAIQEVLEKKPRLLKRFQRPNPDTDRLYKSDFVHADRDASCAAICSETNVVPRGERSSDEDNPKIHYGLIASGNQVMKDAIIRDRVSAEEDVLCFEMEAAGLSNHFPCVVIRGICDYSDSHKNDEWQGYAAMVAAAYAKELLLQISPKRVVAEGKIAEIEGLLTDVSEIKKEVKGWNDKSEREVILDWLTRVDYASQQNDFIHQREPGTGQWFLKSEKFRTWLKEPKAALFCPGMPGAGKTITTAIVIDHLYSEFENDSSTGIAFIYVSFQRRDEQGAGQLLASLLRQLARGLSPLPKVLESLYKKHETRKARPSIEELSQTLQAVIRLYSTTFIIIDALDECQTDDRKTFLSDIGILRNQTTANIFITSRPDLSLEGQLEGFSVQEICAHDDDVMSYIDSQTAKMILLSEHNVDLELDEKKNLKALIRGKVGKAVDGIFLLARFHLDSLQDKTTPNQILAGLKELPTGPQAYDESYGKTMIRIHHQGEGFRNLAKEVLTWLTFARRPLSPKELRHALGVRIGSSELDVGDLKGTDLMIRVCMGLVKIDKDYMTISLLHYTTLEYLQNNPGCLSSLSGSTPTGGLTPPKDKTIYEANENETAKAHGQREITTICATYLSFSVFKSGCCKTYDELKERLESNPFYDYAARNWGYHALEAGSSCGRVKEFLNSEANVAASGQTMMAPRSITWQSASVGINPSRMTALHLVANFGLHEEITRLWEDGIQPEEKDIFGRTPLSYAAEKGHEPVVKELLATGEVDPYSRDECDRTPLSYAAEQGHVSVARRLLESREVDLETKDAYEDDPEYRPWDGGRTSLSYAAEKGREEVVRLLLRTAGVDPDSQASGVWNNGRTPLSYAAEAGHEAIIRLLLATNRVHPDSLGSLYDRTPLSYAAEAGHSSVVSFLLSTKRVDPDSKAYDDKDDDDDDVDDEAGYYAGRTPLSLAAEGGHEAVINLLLATEAVEPDSKATGPLSGKTPLAYAAESGHDSIVRLLLSTKRVDPDSKITGTYLTGWTPLSFAVEAGHYSVVDLLLSTKRVDPDRKITSVSHTGWTPLLFATGSGDEAMAKLLLETKGVHPDSKIDDDDEEHAGSTPLSLAAKLGHGTIFRMLLEEDAVDPDSRDSTGRTPLSHAAEHGFEAAVKLLLAREEEVDPNSTDNDGHTALFYAMENGHKAVERLLRDRYGKDADLEDADSDDVDLDDADSEDIDMEDIDMEHHCIQN
ncbi:hypothetical protein NM208_g1444 [Fusarium decemcellulare]|uniref:Uncharacterized protein n=1 Tax=Fusarium decemcellulare TaxID=57161 RepID=A0ACC1SW30_9HYPO|nr:hypothetical protein NM208_g1444 [Fusarium decemcellulare]